MTTDYNKAVDAAVRALKAAGDDIGSIDAAHVPVLYRAWIREDIRFPYAPAWNKAADEAYAAADTLFRFRSLPTTGQFQNIRRDTETKADPADWKDETVATWASLILQHPQRDRDRLKRTDHGVLALAELRRRFEERYGVLAAAAAIVRHELDAQEAREGHGGRAGTWVPSGKAGDTAGKGKANSGGEERKVRIFRASDLVAAEQPRWLAKGRIPRASVSLLVGDEGIGKSLLWVWVAAAVTTGKPLPEFGIPARDPGRVRIVITEDVWSQTVLPRLQVAGADLDLVDVICEDEDGSGAPVFPDDMEYVLAEPRPALVVVDAWLDTVPAKLSVRDPQQARQALHPWKEAATALDAAVLLLTHTNRVASANARDKYGATGELRKKARMTLYAQVDEEGHLVVGPEKSNTSTKAVASVFAIDGVPFFEANEEHDGTVPRLRYVGESDRTAAEHITANYEGGVDESMTEAEEWLHDYLTAAADWVPSKDVKAAGRDAGIATRTLQRAAKRVASIASRDMPRRTFWAAKAVAARLDPMDLDTAPATDQGAE